MYRPDIVRSHSVMAFGGTALAVFVVALVIAAWERRLRARSKWHQALPIVRWDGRRLEIHASAEADGYIHRVTAAGEIAMDEIPSDAIVGGNGLVLYGRSVETSWAVRAGKNASVPLSVVRPGNVDRIRVTISSGLSRRRCKRTIMIDRTAPPASPS